MIDAEDMAIATDDQMGLERLAEQFLASQDKRQKRSGPEVGGSSSSKDVHISLCEKVEQVEANPQDSKGQRVDRGKCELCGASLEERGETTEKQVGQVGNCENCEFASSLCMFDLQRTDEENASICEMCAEECEYQDDFAIDDLS